jgi:hypothetical protein
VEQVIGAMLAALALYVVSTGKADLITLGGSIVVGAIGALVHRALLSDDRNSAWMPLSNPQLANSLLSSSLTICERQARNSIENKLFGVQKW